jgi:outer membrane immunogenic protein
MKRILIAGAFALAAGGQALAADLPQPAPPPYIPAPVPIFTWTGIYLGINGGGAFGDSNWSDPVLARLHRQL